MKTAIRMDDITPDMDFDKFYRFKKILDTYQIKPLIGVVPFNKDKNLQRSSYRNNFGEFLSDLVNDGYVVALHGYHHEYTSSKGGLFPLNHFSEYAGVPYEKQAQMLREGKEQLQKWGIDTDIFMAPAHTFDENTLKALKENGFRAITDGFGNVPYRRSGLVFYPIAKRRTDCVSDKQGYSTLVIHANTIEEDEFKKYENLIANNKDHFISYVEYLQVEPENRTIFKNMTEYMLALFKYILVSLRKSKG